LCNAAAGWDGPTGYGTPNASLLAPGGTTKADGTGTGSQDITGGCSTGGGVGGGAMLGLAMLGLRRRRR
jgi:MYXO-CTERM domain-containing protein